MRTREDYYCSDGMCGAEDCRRCYPSGTVDYPPRIEPCPACQDTGWLLVDVNNQGDSAIQRCDTCGRYENDNVATEAVARDARCWYTYLKRIMS